MEGAFRAEPVLGALLRMLGRVAAGLVDAAEWRVNVRPFRVTAAPGDAGIRRGNPTRESDTGGPAPGRGDPQVLDPPAGRRSPSSSLPPPPDVTYWSPP